MADAQEKRSESSRAKLIRRWMLTCIALALPLIIDMAPKPVEGRPFNAGAKLFPVNCSAPRMYVSPTFASLQGSASYPFGSTCYAAEYRGPGHSPMELHFEGRWNPSETRQDRPNAVESVVIESYEDFLPDRAPRGKIFVYWTARCNMDPWLQNANCVRLGAYVPDDIRAAIPDLDSRPFPETKDGIPAARKPVLIQQYQAANTPPSNKQIVSSNPGGSLGSMLPVPNQSQVITPSQQTHVQAMTVQPQTQTALPKPNTSVTNLSRSGIFTRGVEEKEGQSIGQQESGTQPENVESSVDAVVVEGPPEIVEAVALTLDRPFHTMDAKGDAVEFKSGIYEIGTIMDLQLGLAQEGEPTVLLNTQRDTHNIPIRQTIAVLIPGPSNDVHLLFLTPDSRRFTAIGYASPVKSRSVDMAASLPDKTINDAVVAAAAKLRSVSSPACQPNPAEVGPRWIPVPCTAPTTPSQAPSP